MPVLGPWSVTLEVPSLEDGLKFYKDAGLATTIDGSVAGFRCPQQLHESIVLLQNNSRKKLHHIALRATELDSIATSVLELGGRTIDTPEGFAREGLWIEDPHRMKYHLIERPSIVDVSAGSQFEINAPGRVVRNRRSAMLPSKSYGKASPLRLGHVLVFTPDVLKSVEFATQALGMGLADCAQDVIAFCCAKRDSDHHVLAFAKSSAIGFHHASFQVRDPDEVGRAGRALVQKTGKGDWGFGRHTIGSNFFHYIQDPWGSWFEYYADMDYIDDYSQWTATNYGLEDSLANWGPEVPKDFIYNYEADSIS